ncbi:MAG: helix-turn-helix domain-containing protein [Deltaproteobacteria bacterium]|nr:helix-turn-helix domain-containing protein [Deltaproteobacteria bacterium]
MDERYFIHSFARGLKLLEHVAEAGEPATLSQIAKRMDMTPPTTYRFLYTLQALGFVETDTDRKTYRLTPKILRFGHGLFRSSELWNTAHPYLVKASREYSETFNLAILDHEQILYIDRIKTRSILTINLTIGSKLPAFCTSMGRVLLSRLPVKELRKRLKASPLTAYTPHTVTSVKQLEKIIEQVRRQGYAVNNGELSPELCSVAAPILNQTGETIAALNMAVHKARHDDTYIETVMVPAVVTYAARISQAMGYFDDDDNRACDHMPDRSI